MFQTLAKKIRKDKDLPDRVWRLTALKAVLDGTIYDSLQYAFHEERTGPDEYVPLRDRRPCVRYNLCKLIVDDTTAMVFSEGRFPAFTAAQKSTVEDLKLLSDECSLPALMHEAAWRGSVGSSAILFRVLRGRPFFDVMDTRYLVPQWDPEAPDTLVKVTERYKASGADLSGIGYDIALSDMARVFWFCREWDAENETWFVPALVEDDKPPKVDNARSVNHALGFVPLVWMRNLPGGDRLDGNCTFEPAIDSQIEIEYQLSQAGRGLKYSSDPLLMVREPVQSDGAMVRSASNAIIVAAGSQGEQGGDAKLLEINGSAAGAVVEYVRALREFAMEVCHGNRSNADKISAAQSGRAMELLHRPLLQMADVLRTSYGVNGLLPLTKMVCAASHRVPLKLSDKELRNLDPTGLSLRWPMWFDSTEEDKQAQATTLSTLRNAGLLSRETAVNVVAPTYDVEDVASEISRIATDDAAADARMKAQAAQVKATEDVPE